MTTYRLMDGADGRPGNGPGVTSYAGAFQAGIAFTVTQGGMWLEGYYWWCPAGGDTGAQQFCLWNRITTSTETLVSGSVVTSGTLTAGQWNYIALSTPIQLGIGGLYVAATGWTAVHGFPDTNSQFGSGDPYASGITNGPLYAPGDTSAGGTCAPLAGSYDLPQGLFGTNDNDSSPDPSISGNMPAGGSGSSNFWIDVLVSDTAPEGYSGSYRFWPNKGDTSNSPTLMPLPTTWSAPRSTLASAVR